MFITIYLTTLDKMLLMNNKLHSVMVTGHRPNVFTSKTKSFALEEMRRIASKLKNDYGMQEAITGMALGVDTWWAQINLELGVPIAAYIPFEAQINKWPQENVDEWKRIRSLASREIVVADHFSVRNLHARNDAMIKDSDLAVAVWDSEKTFGGTYSAVQKILKKGLPVVIIDIHQMKTYKKNF